MPQENNMTALREAVLRGLDARGIQADAADAIVAEVSKLDLCLGKAKPNEPIFVLRAQDLLSEGLVRDWAAMARSRGLGDEKHAHALRIADAMHEWPNRKNPD